MPVKARKGKSKKAKGKSADKTFHLKNLVSAFLLPFAFLLFTCRKADAA
jgi:hypothetical protein